RPATSPAGGRAGRPLDPRQDRARAAGASLWQAAHAGAIGGKAGASLAMFVKLIESMRAASAGLPLPEAVKHVNEASGLAAHYRMEKDGQDRIDNLNELVNAAGRLCR